MPVGVEDGKIPNGYITSSSTFNRYHAPWLGRLNNKARGRNKGAWSAKKNDKRQWLQFNLGKPTLITAIRTQGRHDYNQWVTSYKVYFGNDGVRFIPYKKGGRVKVSVYRRKAVVTEIFCLGISYSRHYKSAIRRFFLVGRFRSSVIN